ncbi:uncharacterized protein METZ01_LOCUS30503 [marine metagenome]|uniref:Uncharacterized protein n=1 Tax=marine metagenome TaxID=408172 RepID=A0A381QGY2_9ZZZZ
MEGEPRCYGRTQQQGQCSHGRDYKKQHDHSMRSVLVHVFQGDSEEPTLENALEHGGIRLLEIRKWATGDSLACAGGSA